MILTTNRISSFDPAAQSRIHLALKYDILDTDQKIQIFDSFLLRLEDKHLLNDYESIRESMGALIGSQKLNGRQIRNIVSSAKALADYESRKVNCSDFETMIVATVNFQDQIDEINKHAREEAEPFRGFI
jgi:SpoVK/Ycf46/Vps4 family AAA+-type ATPase